MHPETKDARKHTVSIGKTGLLPFFCILLLSISCTPDDVDSTETLHVPTLLKFSQSDFKIIDGYEKGKQYFPQQQWLKAADPELFGWSSQKLAEIENFVQGLSTDALVIVDKGVVIYSYGAVAERFKCRSMRKSFLSALYGIHVAEGDIDISKTLEELGVDDIGNLSKQEKQATIRDLLSSKSGVYHAAAYETSSMREKRPARESHPPGTFWFYNNWDFNTLLTIFEQETKTGFFLDFREKIAKPLSMQQFRMEDTRYYYERSKSQHPAYLFKMSALDLARFGLLFESDGLWEGKQIIPSEWIQESTYPHTIYKKRRSSRRGYGYLWVSADDGYYAAGKGGQRIMIIPDLDVVVVHLVDSSIKGRKIKSKDFWKLIKKVKSAKKIS